MHLLYPLPPIFHSISTTLPTRPQPPSESKRRYYLPLLIAVVVGGDAGLAVVFGYSRRPSNIRKQPVTASLRRCAADIAILRVMRRRRLARSTVKQFCALTSWRTKSPREPKSGTLRLELNVEWRENKMKLLSRDRTLCKDIGSMTKRWSL